MKKEDLRTPDHRQKNTTKTMASSSPSPQSEGFDLDAISASQTDDDVIYELGGGATIIPTPTPTPPPATTTNAPDVYDPLSQSESLKTKGNECFKQNSYLDAIDYYTDAIEACPGISGEELLELKAQHEEQEREKANQRYKRDSDRRLKRDKVNDNQEEEEEEDLAPKEFIPPQHEYGANLAVYYSNKAACLIHLERYDEAISSCSIAILVQPTYVKAYVRRMACHEQTSQSEKALKDAKKALELSPNNKEIKKHVNRLQKQEDERMEQLKVETMDKLKDLGNSILGNFGMSLNNFKAEKDPDTGSFSIKMV